MTRSQKPSRRLPATTLPLALAVWTLLAASPASSLPRAKERWIEVRTTNFTLLSGAGEGITRGIAGDLEALRATLARWAPGLELGSPLPTTIYVFENDAALRPYKLLFNGKPANVSGFFASHSHGNYVAIDGNPKVDPRRLIYHEYLHYVLRNNFPTVPLWLNEGMAELYSTFEADDRRVRIGLAIARHLVTLRRHGLIPLEELFATGRTSSAYNEGTRQGIFYAQSWGLVHYLLLGDEARQQQAADYLRLLAEDVPPRSAFERAFGTDLEGLGRELSQYLRGYQLGFVEAPAPARAGSVVAVRELPRHETLFRLGDLLAHCEEAHWPAAEEHLRASLALRAGYPPSLAALGVLADSRGDTVTALELFARAAAGARDDAHIQYLYGEILLRALGGDPISPRTITPAERESLLLAREALERSVALRPDYAEAWAALGFTHTIDERPSPAAVRALETAARLLPGRMDTQYNLLLLYTRLGDRARAEDLVERVLAVRGDAQTLAQARQALINLDVQDVNALLAEQRLAAAADLMARVVGRTQDRALAASLQRQLAQVRSAIAKNRFVDRYNEAADLANRRDYRAAEAVLEALLETLEPGADREDALHLLEQIKRRRGGR